MSEYRIRTPVSEGRARKLNVGDLVYIDGIIHVWRDRAYDYALELLKEGGKLPVDLKDGIHWHCGPITRKIGDKWSVISAGPTTSMRFNELEPVAIRDWGIRLVIGKGLGMGEAVSEALKLCGAAYLTAIGGAASYYAKKINRVKAAYWTHLGMPETLWVFDVADFGPLEVSMDSHGRNLYGELLKEVNQNLATAKSAELKLAFE